MVAALEYKHAGPVEAQTCASPFCFTYSDTLVTLEVHTPEPSEAHKNQYVAFGNNPVMFVDPWGLRLTDAQYAALQEILERERSSGTRFAAIQSGNTWGDRLLQPFNADSGNNSHLQTAYGPVDIDWFTDLWSATSEMPPGFVYPVYTVGKGIWSITRRIIGSPNGNPWPFQDPGERTAVSLVSRKKGYRSFLTDEFFEKEYWSYKRKETDSNK